MLIERYQQRARSVHSALLGSYLGGANGRRIRGAFCAFACRAIFQECDLANSGTASKGVYRVAQALFEGSAGLVFLLLGCYHVTGTDRQSVPVLVAMGVKADGLKVVLDLELLGSESSECREGFVEGIVNQGAGAGLVWWWSTGTSGRQELAWDPVQHCTVHKLRNLERHTPRLLWRKWKAINHRIIQPESLDQVLKPYREFIVSGKS